MPVSQAKLALGEYLRGKTPKERMEVMREIQQHPDHIAMERLADALTEVHLSPEVRASAVMSDFVFLIRETLAEFVPGYGLGDLVEPLQRLMAASQALHASKAPRPGARDPVRRRVVEMMKREKRGGTEFKVLMQRWADEPIDDLILTEVDASCTVVDDRDGAVRTWKRSYLSTLFSTKPQL